MTVYKNYIGIDSGKFTFVVNVEGSKSIKEYNNNAVGITAFLKDHKKILPTALCIVEATGGYEREVLYACCKAGYAIHRADAKKVKYFIRSMGNRAKTDRLDAMALALYGCERASRLEVFKPLCESDMQLVQFVQRRDDLKKMLVAEKNRAQSPSIGALKPSVLRTVKHLEAEIKDITNLIDKLFRERPDLQRRKDIIKSIPGIGDVVAMQLLILLPQLGFISAKQIASFAGLAPRANESGTHIGYRPTGHGKAGVKPILFMAALAACRSNSHLKLFYEQLIARGKKKMVAITALMRKILVIANAKLKSLSLSEKHS